MEAELLTKSRYARYRHRELNTTGPLFERRYRAKWVELDAYLFTLLRYIHRNPVAAGIVSEPADYAWSSHSAYLRLESIRASGGLVSVGHEQILGRTAAASDRAAKRADARRTYRSHLSRTGHWHCGVYVTEPSAKVVRDTCAVRARSAKPADRINSSSGPILQSQSVFDQRVVDAPFVKPEYPTIGTKKSLNVRTGTGDLFRVIPYDFVNEPQEIAMHSAKQAARELIEQLPDSVSWNDLMYELYVKQKIEDGLKELDEGRGIPHEEVKRRLLGKQVQ